jgi:hypothetical protein
MIDVSERKDGQQTGGNLGSGSCNGLCSLDLYINRICKECLVFLWDTSNYLTAMQL